MVMMMTSNYQKDPVAYLQTLADTQEPFSHEGLRIFSHLTAQDVAPLWQVWLQIPDERRIPILREMAMIDETTSEFDFQAFYVACLDDPIPTIRTIAVEGLWQEANIPILRRMLELVDDESLEVQEAVMLSLSYFASLALIEEITEEIAELVYTTLLQKVQQNNYPIQVRRRALESLAYFSDKPNVHEEIAQAYAHTDQQMRESALLAMGRSMDKRWLATIQQELTSPIPALRFEAAQAAGEFADMGRSFVEKLVPLTEDEDIEVAIAAILALGEIGGQQAKRTLNRLIQHRNKARSEAASEAMESLMLFYEDSPF